MLLTDSKSFFENRAVFKLVPLHYNKLCLPLILWNYDDTLETKSKLFKYKSEIQSMKSYNCLPRMFIVVEEN